MRLLRSSPGITEAFPLGLSERDEPEPLMLACRVSCMILQHQEPFPAGSGAGKAACRAPAARGGAIWPGSAGSAGGPPARHTQIRGAQLLRGRLPVNAARQSRPAAGCIQPLRSVFCPSHILAAGVCGSTTCVHWISLSSASKCAIHEQALLRVRPLCFP